MTCTLSQRTESERKMSLIDTAIMVHGSDIKLGKFLIEPRIKLYKFTFHKKQGDGYTTGEIYETGFMKRLKAKCPECGDALRFVDSDDSFGHCNHCHNSR